MSSINQLDRKTINYALIKALYDQGEDYVDSLWPLAVRVFPLDRSVDSHFVQHHLKVKFDLEIPLHTLSIVLARARRRGHIERLETQYNLTEQGRTYLDTFETEKDVGRRINALVEDMRSHLNEQGMTIPANRVHENLMYFLQKNIEPLVQFLSPSSVPTQALSSQTAFDPYMLDYIKAAEKRKPEEWKTFRDLVLGSIIATVLNAERVDEISDIEKKSFGHCRAFLDTNFIFSILGMDRPESIEPARELYDLLKSQGFRLYVFSFTVDEICRVVNGYTTQAHHYPTNISVDSLYSTLKRNGWTTTQAREFIFDIEKILASKEIQIEWVTGVNLKNYAADQQIRETMATYKPLQDPFHQNHDLAAIEEIRSIRARPVRKIEDVSAFFLTSDRKLSAFDFFEMKHKNDGTICEALLDRLLTNLLWLKHPKSTISLEAIIGAYSRDLFVKRVIWDRFYDVLMELKQSGAVNDDRIATLFYHNYIEGVLKDFDENEIGEVTPEFVLDRIEEAAKLPEQDVRQKIAEKENEFFRLLSEERQKSEAEKKDVEQKWLEDLQQVRTNIRKEAESGAEHMSWGCAGAATCAIGFLVYVLYSYAGSIALSGVSLVIGGTGLLGIWKMVNRNIRPRFSNWLYRRKTTRILKGLKPE